MSLTRRQLLQAAGVAGVAAAGLAACSTGKKEGQPAAAPAKEPEKPAFKVGSRSAKLTLMATGDGQNSNKFRTKLIEEFRAKYPSIEINLVEAPGAQYLESVRTRIASGEPPDIFLFIPMVANVINIAEDEWAQPLDNFITADKYDLADYEPNALGLYKYKGKLYGLPRDYNQQSMYYNVDMFKAAGVPLPPPDWNAKEWTFADFEKAATALTKRSGNNVSVWGFAPALAVARIMNSFLYSNGGRLAKESATGIATELAVTDPAAISAYQFIVDLMHKHKVAPSPQVIKQLKLPAAVPLFQNGKAAMIFSNSLTRNQLQTAKFNWDVAPLPVGQGGKRGSGGGGAGWVMSKATKFPEEAWEFLKFITSSEKQKEDGMASGIFPARRSVFNAAGFFPADKPPKNIKVLVDAQRFTVHDPLHKNWNKVQVEVLNKMMPEVWSNSKSVEAVMQEAKRQGDLILKG